VIILHCDDNEVLDEEGILYKSVPGSEAAVTKQMSIL
jgi:hypothetical protein